jgi:hypothetical protein
MFYLELYYPVFMAIVNIYTGTITHVFVILTYFTVPYFVPYRMNIHTSPFVSFANTLQF